MIAGSEEVALQPRPHSLVVTVGDHVALQPKRHRDIVTASDRVALQPKRQRHVSRVGNATQTSSPGTDPATCASTVPGEITGSVPGDNGYVMTRRQ